MEEKLLDLVSKIKAPLTNFTDLEKVVRAYSNSGDFNFSHELIKENRSFDGDVHTEDEYYSFLFNTWRNSVLSLQDNFELLDDIQLLCSYLTRLPKAKTKDEVITYLNPDNQTMKEIIRKYGFLIKDGYGWNNIYSDAVFLDQEKHFPGEHLLTINADREDVLRICKIFQKRCMKNNLPYYYKFNVIGDTSDNIVIYSDSLHFTDYYDILTGIEKDYPEIFSRVKEPSVIMGRIEDKIGYASQKELDSDFYNTRAKYLENLINGMLYNFIKDYYLLEMKSENSISLIDYLASAVTINYINIVGSNSRNSRKNSKALKKIFETIRESLIKQFEDSRTYKFESIEIGKINIDEKFIYQAVREHASQIFDSFPELYTDLYCYIQSAEEFNCINSNFAFSNAGILGFRNVINGTQKVK